jgi:serine/threonine-protein kinase
VTTPRAGTPSPERWQAIEATLQRALDTSPAERASFLDHACAGDPELRQEVESLMSADPATGFLERAYLPELRGPNGLQRLDAPEPSARELASSARREMAARLSSAVSERYTVERELGHGGMAMVLLARDLRHRRRVAIKVLYPELSAVLGPDRFLKEIELTASLQHPHILPLYDSGSADGLLFYVMPFVEGETLRTRLERERHLPVSDALHLADEVAGALAYAHARGVIHRDIKPENILLQGGHAVVADFGIAIAVQHAGGERMTRTGLSLGTPQYMAPEQAMGDRVVDARADVYALGAVTYEMLAGEAPFSGPTAQSVVARVLTEAPPPLATRRPNVPPHVDAAVRTALEKIPADRFASAAAFAAALQDAEGASAAKGAKDAHGAPGAPGTRPEHEPPAAIGAITIPRRQVAMLAGWALAFVAVAATGGWLRGRATSAPPAVSAPVSVVRVALDGDSSVHGLGAPAIAPDGASVVYLGSSEGGPVLFLRRTGDVAPQLLAGTENAESPFFSPDGTTIGYARDGALWRLSLAGGTPQKIAALPSDGTFTGASWGSNDQVLYGVEDDGLFRIAATGGDPAPIPIPEPPGQLVHPHLLPGGQAALVTVVRGDDAGHVAVVDLTNGRLQEFAVGAGARYAAGQLVFARRGGELFRQAFDLDALQPTGDVVRFETGLDGAVHAPMQLAGLFDAAPGGAIAYRAVDPGADEESVRLVVTDRAGRVQRTIPARTPWSPRFSPDGRRLAYGAFPPGRGPSELWVTDIASGITQQLTDDGRDNNDPRWSPDGQWLAFSAIADRGKDLFVRPVDGGVARQLTSQDGSEWPTGWSSDGKQIVYTQWRDGDQGDVWLQPAGGGTASPLVATRAHETGASISADGRWIAYQSDESGQPEIYVASLPGAQHPVRISKGGGVNPMWGGDGREIYYWREDQLIAVAMKTGGKSDTPWYASPQRLFRASYTANELPMYDVSQDGRRFVLVTRGVRTERLILGVGLLSAGAR